MKLQGKTFTYEWIDNWAGLNRETGSSHHDIAIDSAGRIFMSFDAAPYLRVFTPEGELLESFEAAGPGMHCLFISRDAQGEWLYTVDPSASRVTRSTLKGELVASITREAFGVAPDEKLRPTACTVDPKTGDVWVADGYGYATKGAFGGNKVFRFSADLKLKSSIDFSALPCGALKEPHWIFADTRKGAATTELYIADRRNHRLVVIDGEGNYLRTVTGAFNTPSAFGAFEDYLVVPELEGRLLILDRSDRIIDVLCDGSSYTKQPGWPNRMSGEQRVSPLPLIEPGKFNSPHGIAVDASGNVYMHEWLAGARVTKLKRLA